MPALQVRNLPEDVYIQLCNLAEQEHRSISQQTLKILQEYLLGKDEYRTGRRVETEQGARMRHRQEVFERIEARQPSELPKDFPSAATLIREDRDNR